jgi:putative ubiquitin-RnfH superfamily antitoxin RatB of RatAB toxin-antitoxin module
VERDNTMVVEVAYARPDEQVIVEVEVAEGATLQQALEQSGIAVRFPEIDLVQGKVGVFGKVAKRDRVLLAGDRVEIYRPLIADPKEVRKQRAAAGKRMKRGGGDA